MLLSKCCFHTLQRSETEQSSYFKSVQVLTKRLLTNKRSTEIAKQHVIASRIGFENSERVENKSCLNIIRSQHRCGRLRRNFVWLRYTIGSTCNPRASTAPPYSSVCRLIQYRCTRGMYSETIRGRLRATETKQSTYC